MRGVPWRFGPIAVTNTYTTNILNPGTTTGGVNCTSAPYNNLTILLRHLRVTNKTAGAVTIRLYLGATGANTAGTEILYDYSIPANDVKEFWFEDLRLSTSDFLVGGASAATSLLIEGEGELCVGT
jgi:hypothetical protein